MSGPVTSAPRWFAIDASADISIDTVEFSLDETTWASGVSGTPPQDVQDQTALLKPVPPARVRVWYYVRMGPGNTLIPTAFGKATVHGRVIDGPNTYRLTWEVYFKYE